MLAFFIKNLYTKRAKIKAGGLWSLTNWIKNLKEKKHLILKSQILTQSEGFKSNFQCTQQKVAELKKNLQEAELSTQSQARLLQKKQNKYPVRERIEKLKDPNTCFLEFSALAGRGMYKERLSSSGLVTGVVQIRGRPCVVVANDPAVKGEIRLL